MPWTPILSENTFSSTETRDRIFNQASSKPWTSILSENTVRSSVQKRETVFSKTHFVWKYVLQYRNERPYFNHLEVFEPPFCLKIRPQEQKQETVFSTIFKSLNLHFVCRTFSSTETRDRIFNHLQSLEPHFVWKYDLQYRNERPYFQPWILKVLNPPFVWEYVLRQFCCLV